MEAIDEAIARFQALSRPRVATELVDPVLAAADARLLSSYEEARVAGLRVLICVMPCVDRLESESDVVRVDGI